MSLVDLKSDLSKYRSEVSKEGKSSPDASSATSDKNFATNQPITDGLYKEVPNVKKPKVVSLTSQLSKTKLDEIKKPKPSDVTKKLGTTELDNTTKPNKIDLVGKLESSNFDDIVIPSDKRVELQDRLSSTKLDDIIQTPVENLLINSVSSLSPSVSDSRLPLASGIGLDQIESKFSKISQTRFQSRLAESDVEINPTTPGQNNNRSDTDINRPAQTFDRENSSPDISRTINNAIDNVTDPGIVINVPPQSFDRTDQVVAINTDVLSPIGNITNPLIQITRPPQFFDRTENLVEITRNVNDAVDNIIIPEIEPIIPPLSFSRQEQSPNIITDTIKEGLVVNPDVTVLRLDQGTIHTNDGSEFNIDGTPIKFIGTSELEKMIEVDDRSSIRYTGTTIHDTDRSQLNLDGITPTFPGGRYDRSVNSLYSILGLQEVNFFSNQFAIGFNQRQQLGDSKYIGFSQFVWTGGSNKGPFTNAFIDINGRGFQTFVSPEESLYQPNSSQFDFTKITGVNFFDGNNNNTLGGFTVFTQPQITEYKTETSFLGWQGNRLGAPAVNYFDNIFLNTSKGFTKFAELGQSNYIPDSSIFDFDGNKQQSPSVNYFDQAGVNSNMGFHNFAGFMDSKYVQDSSQYVWVGNPTENAPAVNYLDQFKQFTNTGFHVFAQKYDTKYVKNSSEFIWDGNRQDAPAVNYFDLTTKKTVDGFNTFAQPYESLYVPDSSRFTWTGTRDDAPFANYLDIPSANTLSGFDTFTPFLESKYKNESSTYTWNANRQDAPIVNYFDIQNQYANSGFDKFHALYDSRYVKDSSRFDFDGTKQNAPAVNYFDLIGKYTSVGFHTFPTFKESKYIKDSSEFDWNGYRVDAPAINYFDLQGSHTTTGFSTFASEYDSKYIKESSRFDWDGARNAAPSVNYFDLPEKFTNIGFHNFAALRDSKYIPESSEFDWDGKRGDSPEVNFFDIRKRVTTAGFHRLAEIYDTKYVPEISIFDWDGNKATSPQVNYFDLRGKFTTIGFHRLAEIYDSKYVKDSSEFTFVGKFPKAGTDYFDKEKLNQAGFTLNIQPKGTGKPLGTEYFHESSFYTFKGGRPGNPLESVIDFFANTNQSGFTMDIQRNEGLPATEYVVESSRFDFDGSRPKPQSFFPDSNQSGFTLDIMAKGSGRPGTEYETESSIFDFDGGRPARQSFFPDNNQNGFTIDIMPKGAGNPETEYVTESSRFDFDGLRPTGINYFPNDNASGFTIDTMRKGSGRPLTEYSTESSGFNWRGTRTSAPSNNYFGLYRTPTGKQYIDVQQKNNTTQAGRGFQTFYTDKTKTNYQSGYSIHSTESGPNKVTFGGLNTPVTNFFGFSPSKRDGFLPKMTTNDGTLYPIINPTLTYSLDDGGRLAVSNVRASGGVTTVKGEEFAPLSLGKRPWTQPGTLASLENQVPNITINDSTHPYYVSSRAVLPKTAGAYNKKYERTMRDNRQINGSYLYGLSENAGQLNLQYKKFQLQPNSYASNGFRQDSYILRGIQVKDSVKNELWGNKRFTSGSVEFLAKGGYSDEFGTINEADVQRIDNWLQSPRGLKWQTLQSQLYDNNPLVDTLNNWDEPSTLDSPTAKTRMYNTTSLLDSIRDNTFRGRVIRIRHGDKPNANDPDDFDYYERVVKKMNPSSEGEFGNKSDVMNFPRQSSSGGTILSSAIKNARNVYSVYKYNRLIALLSELIPSAFVPINSKLPSAISDAYKTRGSKIFRLSGKGGPNSGTDSNAITVINRSSHPFMTHYDTSGILPSAYPSTAKRETWFGPKTKTGDSAEDATGTNNTYSGKLEKQFSNSENTFDGVMTALSYLLNGSFLKGKESKEYPGGKDTPENFAYVQQGTYRLLQQREPFTPKPIAYIDRTRANVAGDVDITSTLPIKLPDVLAQTPSGETQADAPIKQYAAVAYGKLKKIPRGDANRSHDFNDFRHDIEWGDKKKTFSTDPAVIDYKTNNLQDKFGFGNPGKVGADRSKPFRSNIKYDGGKVVKKQGEGYEFRGDRINIIDFKKYTKKINDNDVYELDNTEIPGKKDLITFYFTSTQLDGSKSRAAEAIVFRAAFDSITDNHKPSWSPQMYMGRGDPIYLFSSYERDVSFGFTVHIGSRDEQAATWRKLNYLASWTAPDYSTGRFRSPLCRLNIGHLFRKTPGFINSLSYTFDNAGGTWETGQLKEDKNYNNEEAKPGVLQLPKTIQVAVGFTVIGNYRPEWGGVMYSLYDDDGDGLMPAIASSNERVNFFRINDGGGANNPKDDPTIEADLKTFEELEKEKNEAEITPEQYKKMGYKMVPVTQRVIEQDANDPEKTTTRDVVTDTWIPAEAEKDFTARQKSDAVRQAAADTEEAAAKVKDDAYQKTQADKIAAADAAKVAAAHGNSQSDIRIKENIRSIGYGLTDVMKLNPVQYNMTENGDEQVGFIAQEMLQIIPEVVYGKEGDISKGEILTLSYQHLVSVLTKAIQEQQQMLETQSNRIDELENKIKEINTK